VLGVRSVEPWAQCYQRLSARCGYGRASRGDQRQGPDNRCDGNCVDEIHPRENRRLAEQILALGGILISEFAIATPPPPQNFPIRNCIISGMSIGVLVVEAAEYSGRGLQRGVHGSNRAKCLPCLAM
jgi:hypothetical protein